MNRDDADETQCKFGTMNDRAGAIVDEMLLDAKALGITRHVADCGATIVDCGAENRGSASAGRLFSLACMGGLGHIDLGIMDLEHAFVPSVTVTASDVLRCCLGSQYAGWNISGEGFFALGSGPARALYAREEIFGSICQPERSERAVIALETRKMPPDTVLHYIADSCGVTCENLFVLMAPTASAVGSIQIAARSLETGLHKLHSIGFDVRNVLSGWGTAPVAPIAVDDGSAIGNTNDGILYGARVIYVVDCPDEELDRVMDQIPSCASSDYGEPFYDLLIRAGWDFYAMDPLLFSPACVVINNRSTGRTVKAGRMNLPLLERLWFGNEP